MKVLKLFACFVPFVSFVIEMCPELDFTSDKLN